MDYPDHTPYGICTCDACEKNQLRQRVQELEERRCEICGYAEHHREHTGCLRTQLAAAQEEIERLRIALDCTKTDLVRMRCPDFFEGVKGGYETLFDGHLVNMIGLINDYAKQKWQELELSDALQRDKVAALTAERDKATQYWQIAEGRCDALKQQIYALVEAAAKAAEEIRKCDYTPARSTLLVVIASVKEKA